MIFEGIVVDTDARFRATDRIKWKCWKSHMYVLMRQLPSYLRFGIDNLCVQEKGIPLNEDASTRLGFGLVNGVAINRKYIRVWIVCMGGWYLAAEE